MLGLKSNGKHSCTHGMSCKKRHALQQQELLIRRDIRVLVIPGLGLGVGRKVKLLQTPSKNPTVKVSWL